jgi:hypothetical protein
MAGAEIKSIFDIELTPLLRPALMPKLKPITRLAVLFRTNGCATGWRSWLKAREFLRPKRKSCGLFGPWRLRVAFFAHLTTSMN